MESAVGFFQTYAKETFALLVPLITWALNNRFKARAKLQLAAPHSFTFIVQGEMQDAEGNTVTSASVHTASHILSNSGRETATNVEVVFNWKPLCVNLWPSRHYVEHSQPDGRYFMVFESLAPGEAIGLEVLNVNKTLPALINARCDQCSATVVNMHPQPVIAPWKRRAAVALLFMGFASAVYMAVVILQFLVLSN